MNSENKTNKIMLIAGEVSGDAHASSMVKHLKKANPKIEFFGIGGDELSKLEMRTFYHINQMAFLGIAEVIKHLPFIREVHNTLIEWAKVNKPDCAILVDYPGFNLRIAKSFKKLGIPVVWYISPQLWAWGKGRIKKVKKYIDKMIVLFPFEEKFYAGHSVDAAYVGHPLIDKHTESLPKKIKKLNKKNIKLGLLPGSRKQEVKSLLPKMIETARLLFKEGKIHEAEIVKVENLPLDFYSQLLTQDDIYIKIVKKTLKDVLPEYDAVLVASGTATLECGLYRVPMVIVYHVSTLTYLLGKLLVKVKNIGLVNIVAEKQVAIELIQHNFSVTNAVKEISFLLDDDANRKKREELKVIREKLGEGGASEKAANVILDFLENGK